MFFNQNNKTVVALIVYFMLWANFSFSNNIAITNIMLSNKNTQQKYVFVNFNISWENSWRVSTGPQNWDAAWVFMKFRVNGGVWKHVTLSVDDADHNIPEAGSINVSRDGVGAFIYRSSDGAGTITLNNVQLKWMYGDDQLVDDEPNLEIKIFGIEMVYVNQGAFYVGDGVSIGSFWDASKTSGDPAHISSAPIVLRCNDTDYDDELLEDNGILVDGDEGIDSDGALAVDNTGFPTGYNAFYCMKHEITNEEYAEFLNTLTRSQQDTRTLRNLNAEAINPFAMTETGQILSRCCVRYVNPSGGDTEPVHFFCDLNDNGVENEINDGQNIGLVYLGWADCAAYADWAGLRPMTELEFEKASRGAESVPVAFECVWGNASLAGDAHTAYSFNDLDTENEYPQNPGIGIYGNAAYSFTTGHNNEAFETYRINAPIRVGIFATSTSDRINAGASYYGVLDLGGGTADRCVTLGRSEGRGFQGSHGDGYLTTAPYSEGNADNLDWPGITRSSPEDGVNNREGSGYRGGDWNDSSYRTRISDRYMASEDIYYWEHPGHGNPGSGFRCVRTAE